MKAGSAILKETLPVDKPAVSARILVVDDNRAIHEDFKKILIPRAPSDDSLGKAEEALFGETQAPAPVEKLDLQIDSAFQGQEALEIVRRSLITHRPYALAFMDVRMPPGWDGIETTAKIWEIDPDLQIVICTAHSDYTWAQMLQKLGHTDRFIILKKPFDAVEVLQITHSLTRKWDLLQASKHKIADLQQIIVARTMQMDLERNKFKAIFENSPEGIFQMTPEGRFINANPALAALYGYASADEMLERLTDIQQLYVDPAHWLEFQKAMQAEQVVEEFEAEIKCADGTKKWLNQTACKVPAMDGFVVYQGFVVDITEQKSDQRQKDMMEVHLRQAQKLESVGRLAAGVAHEINTPIQYVGDNIRFLEGSVKALDDLWKELDNLQAATQSNTVTPEMLIRLHALTAKIDLVYLRKEMPVAIAEALEGVNRVAQIVRAMKEFSHPGTKTKSPVDIHHAIETTVTVARNEWRYVADLETDFSPDLPAVPCVVGDFNQVMLNLIVNAAQAIGDAVKATPETKGTIRISTRQEGDFVAIRISDTGTGIPKSIQSQIFEPFFTTKDVGKGTGQGLAMARSTIVNQHGGELSFESTPGKGTTFIVRLPLLASIKNLGGTERVVREAKESAVGG